MEKFSSIIFGSLLSFSIFHFSIAADTLTPAQSIVAGQTLISSNQTFELGFFSPGDSNNSYLGIWFKKYPATALWIANRQNPITDLRGVFTISKNGSLALLDGTNSTIWASSNSSRVSENLVVQLLESGNLVLRDESDENSANYIWQSFEFPCDTLLPGMKLKWNSNSSLNRYLTSWRSASDPSPGDFTYGIDNIGLPQIVVSQKTEKKFRSGLWNGVKFGGSPKWENPISQPIFVYGTNESYYTNEVIDHSAITRITLNQTGLIERYILNEESTGWTILFTVQTDDCDDYGHCGANGICRIDKAPICECLDGFIPKSEREWELFNWSSGCVRRVPLDCQKGEGFVKLQGVKLPDLLEFWVNKEIKIKECEAECLKRCSCTAYANSDIRGGGSGCLLWIGDLIDIRGLVENKNELNIYIRMPASELESMGNSRQKRKRIGMALLVSTFSGMLLLGLVCLWCTIRGKRRKRRGEERYNPERGYTTENLKLPLFNLATVSKATNHFSLNNKLGEGGFGPVYKGVLEDGQEIAVKRLSMDSRQGLNEFKNEVIYIAKLQHRNLVKLLGCCIQEDEKMLIYEFMPNKSLDFFIFDHTQSILLDWPRRFHIINGIAQGLLYLHRDSRLRIIHRDLKASNILLDNEMNPKISDFGLARSFGGSESQANTNKVVGTYGYMSPEYAIDGLYSVKSDVFSFGVLLLEVVSGKRNRGFYHPDHHLNLIGHAWRLHIEGKPLELLDASIRGTHNLFEVLRSIHVGLLCVQRHPENRPSMSLVVLMLGGEGALPQPQEPGFYNERNLVEGDSSSGKHEPCSTNEITMTLFEGR